MKQKKRLYYRYKHKNMHRQWIFLIMNRISENFLIPLQIRVNPFSFLASFLPVLQQSCQHTAAMKSLTIVFRFPGCEQTWDQPQTSFSHVWDTSGQQQLFMWLDGVIENYRFVVYELNRPKQYQYLVQCMDAGWHWDCWQQWMIHMRSISPTTTQTHDLNPCPTTVISR